MRKQVSGNALLVKEININLIRRALLGMEQGTKQDLALATGLSVVTATTVLKQMVLTGEVFIDSLVPSNGGRPAQLYRYNMDFKQILVIYSFVVDGQDTFFFKVKNRAGEVVYNLMAALDTISLTSFQPFIDDLLCRFPAISAIGFGLPGVEENGCIASHDYEQLNGVPFIEYYRKLYGLPILYENDVNAAAVGFVSQQSSATAGSCIYIYFPEKYPPGAGLYIKGELYKGFRHMAGEIGQLPIGVDWFNVDYRDFGTFVEGAYRLLATLISVINPEQVILYGQFMTDELLQAIRKTCHERLARAFWPELCLSESFHLDYEAGITALTFSLLDSGPSIEGGN